MTRSRKFAAIACSALFFVACSSDHAVGQARRPPRAANQDTSSVPAACPTRPGRYTIDQMMALRPRIDSLVRTDAWSVGDGANAIMLDLQPGREHLAARMRREFGDAVEISIAGVPYCGSPALSRKCPDLPTSTPTPAGLHLTLHLRDHAMRAQDTNNASLIMKNDAATPLGWDTGQPLIASVVKPGTRHVVGTYAGGILGTGFASNVHDGESVAIPVIVGAARCDGGRGSTLPPGPYGIRAGIGPHEGPPVIFAPEVRIRITK